MIVAVLIAIVLVVLFYYYGYKPMHYWEEKGVVHEHPIPFLGNMGGFFTRKKHATELTIDLYKKFENHRYVGMMQFSKPVLMVRDLDLLKAITIKEFDHFQNRTEITPSENDPTFSKTLIALKGEAWRQMRATLSPAFTSSKMRIMYNLINDCAQNFVAHFKGKEQFSIEMKDFFTRYTNDVIATTAFGITINSLKDPKNEFFTLGTSFLKPDFKQILKFLVITTAPGLAKILHLKILPSKVTSFFRKIVDDNISNREAQNINRPDMIQLLMEAKKGKLKHEHEHLGKDAEFATVEESHIGKTTKQMELTDEHIVAQALLFFLAGFDTASTAACFLAHELAANPDIQLRLQNEIDGVNRQGKGKVRYESLLSMKYLDQIVSESLRMWPPGFQGDRVCVKDFTIPPQLYGEKELVIEKGISVLIPFMAIHRDPKYFPEPDKFDPERFSDENKHKIVPGSYMPFGAGPRNCIGSRFALLEIKTLFFHLLAKFDLMVIDKTEIPMKLHPANLTMSPKNGFNLALRPRKIPG